MHNTFSSKKKWFICLMALLVVFIILILSEIIIRFDNYSHKRQRKIWIPDPFFGFIHAPNNKFIWEGNVRGEFSCEHTTNSLGLIDEPEVGLKQENEFRILILGDSFTEGMQINRGKSFSARLEEYLNQKLFDSKKIFNVLNAGVSGYSPVMEYFLFKNKLSALNPDLVIVQLWTNDIFEDNKVSSMSLFDENGLPIKINRYFYSKDLHRGVIKENELVLRKFFYSLHNFLINTSQFYEYIYTAKIKSNKNNALNKQMQKLLRYDEQQQFFMIQVNNQLYKHEIFRNQTLNKSAYYLKSLKELVEEKRAKFLAFYIPQEAQLGLKEYGDHTKQYFDEKTNDNLNKALLEISQRYNFEFLDLLPVLESNKEKRMYINQDGHLNEVGHEVVADGLFEYLRNSNLLN